MKALFTIPRRPRVLLFDWSNVVARAYSIVDGNGLLLLCKMLRSYRRKFPYWQFAFFLEGSGVAQRRKIFANYKQQREGDGPTKRHPESIDLLECLTGTVVQAAKGESDDAIASYIAQHCQDAAKVVIVSEDRDLWQLINRQVHVLTRKGEIAPEDCQQLLGVPPANVRMLKALSGDTSDNIPGVPRAKRSTLQRLAKRCETLKELGALLDADELQAKEAARIISFRSQIICNWKVIGLRSDLKLTITKHKEPASVLVDYLASQGHRLDPRDAKLIAEEM